MLPLERHRLIVELLGQHGVMRVNEIAQATRVSRETFSPARGWSAIAACMRVRKPTPPC